MKLTTLERTVLDALSDELAYAVPDIRAQIAGIEVKRRSNTGQGFLTDLSADHSDTRPTQGRGLSGIYGTVHADISGLAEPIGFQAVLTSGRLTGLRAQTYGEPTFGIDFAAAPFWGLFRIAPDGSSVPVAQRSAPVTPAPASRPVYREPPKPAPTSQARTPSPAPKPKPAPVPKADIARRQPTPPIPPTVIPSTDGLSPEDRTTTMIGVVAIGLVALIIAITMGLPIFTAFFLAIIGGNMLRNPKVREGLYRMAAEFKAKQAARG